MISKDGLAEIGRIVRAFAANGIRPVALALVFGQGVEGAGFNNEQYRKAYSSAGIAVQCFEHIEAAKSWVLQEIFRADESAARKEN